MTPNDPRKHWHSGQETIFGGFPTVLESWWEISENGDRGFTQNFDTRLVSIVVWPGEPSLEKLPNVKKCTLFENGHVQNFQKSSFFRGKAPRGATKHRGAFQIDWLEALRSNNRNYNDWMKALRSNNWNSIDWLEALRSKKFDLFRWMIRIEVQ